ncbi:hypothetical protein [Breoghania sp. JC706]|uniref:hypothetical protein n=1 Tax=Breoghania sp. JC706 TaxID=3117732 RepID=UPI003009ACDC
MSKFMFTGDASGLHGTAHPRIRTEPDIGPGLHFISASRTAGQTAGAARRRCRAGLARDDMTTADRVKAIIAGIIIGLMLAAPVAALVAVAGNTNEPGVFHDLSPWSFAKPR